MLSKIRRSSAALNRSKCDYPAIIQWSFLRKEDEVKNKVAVKIGSVLFAVALLTTILLAGAPTQSVYARSLSGVIDPSNAYQIGRISISGESSSTTVTIMGQSAENKNQTWTGSLRGLQYARLHWVGTIAVSVKSETHIFSPSCSSSWVAIDFSNNDYTCPAAVVITNINITRSPQTPSIASVNQMVAPAAGSGKIDASTPEQTPVTASVNQNGLSLASFLNSLNVENYWAKGAYVNWETGVTVTGPISHWATDEATHCSGFASVVAAILNVPLLHPPFPSGTYNGVTYTSLFANTYGSTFSNITATSDSLLATKQGQWLANNAKTKIPAAPATTASPTNWVNIDAYQAQSYANQGYLAVVVYEATSASSSGHIAIIAPYQQGKTLGDYPGQSSAYTSLAVDGPYEAQSGGLTAVTPPSRVVLLLSENRQPNGSAPDHQITR